MDTFAENLPDAPAARAQLPQPAGAAAALAWRIAPDSCLRSTSDQPGCVDYHGIYPLLHALGLAATPDRHADFYARELGMLAVAGEYTRVLVTGSANQGMPEHVTRAYRNVDAQLELEVVDLCPTPGLLCLAWAESIGLEIRTHAANILQWQPERPYDAITSHSFVAKFTPDVQPELFAAWASFLRPGGKLVTTARIDPDVSAASAGFSAAKAHAFAENLVATATPWLDELDIDADELHAAALRHCNDIASYPIASLDRLQMMLDDVGFEIESLDLVEHLGRLQGKSSGAGTHRTAKYADFVARRR